MAGERRLSSGGNANARLPAAHLLLCCPVPDGPQTSISPWPGGWGPLLQEAVLMFLCIGEDGVTPGASF